MRLLAFVVFLASWGFSFADVCTRLYELRFENIGRGLLLAVHPDVPPYSDHRDLCVGFVTATTGQPLSCQEAFRRLMKHQERFIDSPPIIHRMDYSVAMLLRDYQEFLSLPNLIRHTECFNAMPASIRGLVQTMETSVLGIIQYMANHFPRMYYDDKTLGPHLRSLQNAVNSIVQDQHYTRIEIRMNVRKYIFREFWRTKWGSYVNILLQSISLASFDEMELMLISYAPIMHAYVHMSTVLQVYYTDQFAGYLWVLSAIVRYDPLYAMTSEDRAWIIPQWYMEGPSDSAPVPIDSGIDLQYLKTSLWNPQDRFPDSPMELQQMVLQSVREKNLHQMKILMVLVRCIGEKNLFFHLDDDHKALLESEL